MRCKLVPMSCNLLNIDRFGGRSCENLSGRGVSRELIRGGKRRESWAHFLTNCISSKKEIAVSITTGKSNSSCWDFFSFSDLGWSVCNNNFLFLSLKIHLSVNHYVCLSVCRFTLSVLPTSVPCFSSDGSTQVDTFASDLSCSSLLIWEFRKPTIKPWIRWICILIYFFKKKSLKNRQNVKYTVFVQKINGKTKQSIAEDVMFTNCLI